MNIRNKNFLLFFSLFIILGSVILAGLTKYIPLFLQHTVYYCQQLLTGSSLQLPQLTGGVLLFIPAILISLAFGKLALIALQNWKLKYDIKRKVIKKTLPQLLLREYSLQDKVYLFRDNSPQAVCIGLRNPKIYLSTKMLSLMNTHELKAILIHEKQHMQEKDSLLLVFAIILQTLFPFFPLFSDLIRKFKIDREIDADKRAIAHTGDPESVISVLKKLLSYPTTAVNFASAIGDYDTLEQRIRVLTHRKTKRQITIKRSLLSITILGIIVAATALPVHAIELQNMDKNAMMLCLEGGTCASWCKEHNTVIPYSSSDNASHAYSPSK